MKKPLAIALSLLAVSAMAAPTVKEWQKRYDALSKTITSRDLKGFMSYVADDLVWVQANGKTANRAEAVKEFAPMFTATKITGGEKVIKVTQRGDLIDVRYDTHLVMTFSGKKPEPFAEKGVDTWKKINGKWLIVKSVTDPEKK